jgi:hypothetical protein
MAAGKSTVAQLLAEKLDRSAHVRGDAFRQTIVSGRADMLPDQAAESLDQLRLRYRLGAMVAEGYGGAGFTALVEDVSLGPELADFADRICTRPRYVVALVPTPACVDRATRASFEDWVRRLDRCGTGRLAAKGHAPAAAICTELRRLRRRRPPKSRTTESDLETSDEPCAMSEQPAVDGLLVGATG